MSRMLNHFRNGRHTYHPLNLTLLLSVWFLAFVALAPVAFSQTLELEPEGCTSVLVGKLASIDGSTMTSHSCDSGSDRTWINIVPRQKHQPGATAKIYRRAKNTEKPSDHFDLMSEIPQVAETYAFINTCYPVMNEYQLAIGETTCGGKRELVSRQGKIDCPELYRLVLERAKTAREAIKVIDELTKEHGYNDVGECFTFADPNETWHFEILGPGKDRIGAVWAAVRIPDDHVGVSANSHRIRRIELSDSENYLASDNVFSLAEEMGWWDPKSGQPFEFCYAYASRTSLGSRHREWSVLNAVAPSLNLNYASENFPLSVKAEKKLSVADVLKMFRNYYQGTDLDMTRTMTTVDRDGNVVKSPVANPFMSSDMLKLLNIQRERTVACSRATYVNVTQSRAWLPDAIGGVVWLGYDNPATTPHTPFYCGISQMPEAYLLDGRRDFSRDCAWWAFRRVSKLADLQFETISKEIEQVWRKLEDQAFANQQKAEQEAARLYRQDPAAARKFLTDYSHRLANEAVDAYWKLGDSLWVKYL